MGYRLPFDYQELNEMRGHNVPSNNICYDSQTYFYFWRSLYQRVCSKIKWKVPEHWVKDIMIFNIYDKGFVGVFDTNKYARTPNQKFGIIPTPATVYGIGPQMQPAEIRTANPYFFMPYSERIYEGAGLIKLTGDYKGIFDIIDFYAEQLAILWTTIPQSIINARFSYIVSANSTAASATLKALFDGRNSGKPLMVYDKDKLKKKTAADSKTSPLETTEPFEFMDLKVGQNYITDKLLRDYRTIMNFFDTEVGIPNNPTDKAERVTTNEVESNSAETVARFEYFLENLQESIEKTIKVFPELKGQLSAEARIYDTGQTGAKEAGKEVSDAKQDNDSRVS